MKKYLAAVVGIVLLFFTTSVVGQSLDVIHIHNEMLSPIVKVTGGGSSGSGSVIFSEPIQKGNDPIIATLILTNFHVVETAIKEKQDIFVNFYAYKDYREYVGVNRKKALVLIKNEALDLALLEVDDAKYQAPYVARIIDEKAKIYIGETVFAVGAGLGASPFLTSGYIGSLDAKIKNVSYLMSSAPIVNGNSGGALFRKTDNGEYEMIGIPTAVATLDKENAIPVYHIDASIPYWVIIKFLKDSDLGFVLEQQKTHVGPFVTQ